MRALTCDTLLAAWEAGMAESHLPARALTLLAAGWPDALKTSLAQLPIGERDRRLLMLRQQAFGSRVAGVAGCPDCSSTMEFELNVEDITVASRSTANDTQPEFLSYEGYEITFHLPTSLDLAAIGDRPGLGEKMRLLLERLVERALWKGSAVPAAELPLEVLTALETQLAQVDPQADIELSFCCDACGRVWQACFDIASFLWSEVHAWALLLMRDVHALARGYGWREADILAMSAWRRQRYLELLSE